TAQGGGGGGDGGAVDARAADAAGGAGGGLGGSGTTTGGAGGSAPAASPGSVTLRLKIASASAYCDQDLGCQQLGHISIRSSSGQSLNLASGPCPVPCDVCKLMTCPGLGVVCAPQGIEVHDEQLTWDGSYYESSTCGAMALQCSNRRFAAAGQY